MTTFSADLSALSDDQLDGVACIVCGNDSAPQIPVGIGPRGQIFACELHKLDAVNWQGSCDLHPGIAFPVRADRRDADEDKHTHMHTPGSHTVRLRAVDTPPAEADGFPEAGAADRLLADIDRALEAMREEAPR